MSSTKEQTNGHSLTARIFVGIAATLALLLLGAAVGLMIKVPSDQSSASDPSPVDIGFAQDMSVHHEQAVTMATLARERASDPHVRSLAFDIETNQRGQIGRMHGWLSLWDQPVQTTGEMMQWMSEPGHNHGKQAGHDTSGGLMPGMASSEEMAHLRTLQGPEFDIEFLQLMLRHHEGGAPMAKYGRDHAALDAVQRLSGNMLSSQSIESDLMRTMLAERGAQPLN